MAPRTSPRTARLVAAAGLAVVALTACIADDGGAAAAEAGAALLPSGSAGPDGDGAARFLACLAAGGVPARLGEMGGHLGEGMVFVQTDATPVDGFEIASVAHGTAPGSADLPPDVRYLLVQVADESGTWQAAVNARHFEATGMADVATQWAACEEAHPDFSPLDLAHAENPGADGLVTQSMAAGVPFAREARAAGLAWVPDPTPEDGGAIALPPTISEAEFRTLVELAVEGDHQHVTFRLAPDAPARSAFDVQDVLTQVAGDAIAIGVLGF